MHFILIKYCTKKHFFWNCNGYIKKNVRLWYLKYFKHLNMFVICLRYCKCNKTNSSTPTIMGFYIIQMSSTHPQIQHRHTVVQVVWVWGGSNFSSNRRSFYFHESPIFLTSLIFKRYNWDKTNFCVYLKSYSISVFFSHRKRSLSIKLIYLTSAK